MGPVAGRGTRNPHTETLPPGRRCKSTGWTADRRRILALSHKASKDPDKEAFAASSALLPKAAARPFEV